MLILISPAKTLDLSESPIEQRSNPDFKREIKELVSIMKKKKPKDIKELMHVSDNLATLNHERYQRFEDDFSVENAKQALLAFKGDVYTKIDVDNFSSEDFEFAQRHLRILSGLYGLLKPLDLIQPYRLEMGVKLKNKKGKDLYSFWGSKIARAIDEVAEDGVVVNLASQEYFKAVDRSTLQAKVITPTFKEYRDGTYKVIGLFAKQARGLMTDFAIKNRLTNPEALKTFQAERYEYSDTLSSEDEWVFVR
ncbi:MAG: peroxide stress protein YaaA [Lunatimonas sp.]|uniref:peroxide stress protein YaaA n=1 Tax=Lunatimonas sp. TaxID=2060141 RepID=UPI00263BDE0B|nr:peroxide stress protein YaaA [Lunatimonas sp.]MCC5936204.1 peroxide stress protein YaaA [Lunatimonas sp.]